MRAGWYEWIQHEERFSKSRQERSSLSIPMSTTWMRACGVQRVAQGTGYEEARYQVPQQQRRMNTVSEAHVWHELGMDHIVVPDFIWFGTPICLLVIFSCGKIFELRKTQKNEENINHRKNAKGCGGDIAGECVSEICFFLFGFGLLCHLLSFQ
jgi:hypothetical protein